MDNPISHLLASWNSPGNTLWCDLGGELQVPPHHVQIHESHPVSTLELITQGEMIAEYRGVRSRLEAGDAIFLSAGEPHRLTAAETGSGYTKLFVSLLGSGLSQLVRMIFGQHYLFSTHGLQTERVRRDFLNLIMLLSKKESKADVSSTLFHLMMELSEAIPTTTEPELTAALKYMNAHLTVKITSTELAAQLQIRATRLQALFKKNLQTTPAGFFQRLRMDKASELLKNSSLSIKEISNMVGYHSGLTFAREFKKHFGVLPTHFRRGEVDCPSIQNAAIPSHESNAGQK